MEQLLEITRIRLGAVVNENLIHTEADTSGAEVVFRDGLTQEIVALLWSIAMNPLCSRHFVGGLVHRLDDGRCQRLRHIANTQGDDVSLGVHHSEGIDLLGDVGEQIVVLQVQEVNID